MIALLAAAASAAALMLFGLATERHHGERFGRHPSPMMARRWRAAAWALLAIGYAAATAAWGWTIGPVAWIGLAMAGAAASFLFLNLMHVRTPTRATAKVDVRYGPTSTSHAQRAAGE